MNEKQKNDGLMKIAEVARYLNMSVARVRYEILIRRIPYIKLGASIRFDKTEIDRWIEERAFGSKP